MVIYLHSLFTRQITVQRFVCVFYQGEGDELSFGDDGGGETEPLLPPPAGNTSHKVIMSDGQAEIILAEAEPQKQGITRERLFVVLSILVTELCERLTYYSVVANMVLFCTSVLKMKSDDASVVTLVFSGKIKFKLEEPKINP